MEFLKNMQQSGLLYLSAQYCEPHKLSEDYKNMLNFEILSDIQKQFGLDKLESTKMEKNTKLFKEKYSHILGSRHG